MRLAENMKIVPVLASANVGASTDFDSIDMSRFHKATFVITCGAFTGDGTFTAHSGTTEGTKTTAVPFRHALGGAAIGTAVLGSTASCDVLGAAAEAANGTAAITCTTKMVVIDVDAAAMTNGHKWLTLAVTATAGIAHGVAYLEPRYSNERSVTALK
jgi:hypothetical protein